MKNVIAISIALALTACGSQASDSHVAAETAPVISQALTSIYGTAAVELYDVLNVEAVLPNGGPNGGINPLQGLKTFKTSDDSVSITCELRLFSKICTIISAPEFVRKGYYYLYTQTSLELYDALGVKSINPEASAGPSGINPLLGSKSFKTTDGTLRIDCDDRLFSKICTISL